MWLSDASVLNLENLHCSFSSLSEGWLKTTKSAVEYGNRRSPLRSYWKVMKYSNSQNHFMSVFIPLLLDLDTIQIQAMLPRVSYFPLILPKVINYFTSTCEELRLEQDKLWLEYSRQPIKMFVSFLHVVDNWLNCCRYYPIGVLFDMMKTDDFLPWTISLRTKVKNICNQYYY